MAWQDRSDDSILNGALSFALVLVAVFIVAVATRGCAGVVRELMEAVR